MSFNRDIIQDKGFSPTSVTNKTKFIFVNKTPKEFYQSGVHCFVTFVIILSQIYCWFTAYSLMFKDKIVGKTKKFKNIFFCYKSIHENTLKVIIHPNP